MLIPQGLHPLLGFGPVNANRLNICSSCGGRIVEDLIDGFMGLVIESLKVISPLSIAHGFRCWMFTLILNPLPLNFQALGCWQSLLI